MASFEVILSHFPTGKETVTRSVTVLDVTRALAIPMGIDELLAMCEEENPVPIPQAAIEWWPKAKISGYPLSEVLTRLEGEWGVTFEIKDVAAANGAVPETAEHQLPPARNGAIPLPVKTGPLRPLDDLTTILNKRLQYLEARNTALTAQMDGIREDWQYVQEQIQEAISALAALSTTRKKGRVKKDAESSERSGPAGSKTHPTEV